MLFVFGSTLYIVLLAALVTLPGLCLLRLWWSGRRIPSSLILCVLAVYAIILICRFVPPLRVIGLLLIALINLGLLLVLYLYNRQQRQALQQQEDAEVRGLQGVVTAHPQNAAYLRALADAYRDRGRVGEAMALYEQVITLLPDHSSVERREVEKLRQITDQSARVR